MHLIQTSRDRKNKQLHTQVGHMRGQAVVPNAAVGVPLLLPLQAINPEEGFALLRGLFIALFAQA